MTSPSDTETGSVAPVDFADLLTGVSRTFALSIPELPEPLDSWVTCAYLVCRIVDTLEDRPGLDEAARQRAFDALLSVLGPPVDVSRWSENGRWGENPAGPGPGRVSTVNDPCATLMASSGYVFEWLTSFPEPAVAAVRRCVTEMIAGLRRTPLPPGHDEPRILFETIHQLERYCHYAAGAVGLMLTRLFAVHLGEQVFTPNRAKLHAGKRFGRGLQLTNIIKDHPADLRDGRCFIPREALRRFSLTRADLLRPHLPFEVRRWIVDRALAHLKIALDYTLSIPPAAAGIRRFCLQPLMMAVLTLERVLTHPDITPDDRPKITRAQVAEVISFSVEYGSHDAAIRAWFESSPSLKPRVNAC
ncbi:MAG TPA: phytoene/squalene synthase family protein [Phycisphaerae bacterium]|jgi:farnesyl-diphosphate farnesyltransferase